MFKHGHAAPSHVSPTYRTWQGMKNRCSNPKDPYWHIYGGKGITVCQRWATFENFLADMGERPAGKSLDRINGNGNYEPGNCRWATQREQIANSSLSKQITHNGQTHNWAEWGRVLGLSTSAIGKRIARGWDAQRAVTTPRQPGRTPNDN